MQKLVLEYYNKIGGKITIEELETLYKNSEFIIISGITNTGKKTLAKTLSDFNFGTISSNISLHTFDGEKIALIHASSMENASLVYSEVYNAPSMANYIHIERDNNKFFLELNNSTMEQYRETNKDDNGQLKKLDGFCI